MQNFTDECARVEVKRRFSLAKRKCGLGLITKKLREIAAHSIAMPVLVLNLRKLQRTLLQLLLHCTFDRWSNFQMEFVQ